MRKEDSNTLNYLVQLYKSHAERNYNDNIPNHFLVQLMGNLLRRVCEGGSVIYGVLAVLGCTFSGGNITLGCPARAPDNISSPLVCVP